MQGLVFNINTEDQNECIEVARRILSEKMNYKRVLKEFASKDDFDSLATSEKEFLFKQLFKLNISLLRSYNTKLENQSEGPPKIEREEIQREDKSFQYENPAAEEEKFSEIEALKEEMRSLKEEIELLTAGKKEVSDQREEEYSKSQEEISRLRSEMSKLAKLTDSEAEARQQSFQENQKLKSEMAELESKYQSVHSSSMMQSYKRNLRLDQEVHTELVRNMTKWQMAVLRIQSLWRGFKQRQKYLQEKKLTGKPKVSADDQIIKQMFGALKRRHMTLEECFRAADKDGDGHVTSDEFLSYLSGLKLGLDHHKISRVVMLSDEDCSGVIQAEEFYKLLEAYSVASENHRESSRSYSQEILLKFCQMLDEREIEPYEIFNMCDLNGNGAISTDELENFLIGSKFQKKEIHSLMNILDTDKSGVLSKEEFVKHLSRGKHLFKIESTVSTSAMKQPKETKAKVDPNQIKELITKMESRGVTLAEAFEEIERTYGYLVSIPAFLRSLQGSFPHISNEQCLSFVKCVNLNKDNKLSLEELEEFLLKYSVSGKMSTRQLISKISGQVQHSGISTSELFASHEYTEALDLARFIRKMDEMFSLSESQSLQLFKYLDSDKKGSVDSSELIILLDYLRKDVKGDLNTTVDIGITIRDTLKQRNMNPYDVFRFADKYNRGRVTVQEFSNGLLKLIPSFNKDLLKRLNELFPHEYIDKLDIENAFPAANDQISAEEAYWIKEFMICLRQISISLNDIFSGKESLSVNELKANTKRLVPVSVFKPSSLMIVIHAIDRQQTGEITLQHFENMLEESSKIQGVEIQNYGKKVTRTENELAKRTLEDTSKATNSFRVGKSLPVQSLNTEDKLRVCFSLICNQINKKLDTISFIKNMKYPLESLFNEHRFAKLCLQLKVTRNDASLIFNALDVHSKGTIPLYTFATVIESYRKDLSMLPLPAIADTAARNIMQMIVNKYDKSIPLYKQLPELTDLVNWNDFSTIDQKDLQYLKEFFPASTAYVHFASVAYSYIRTEEIALDPIQIMHCAFEVAEVNSQAPDFFSVFSLSANDSIDRNTLLSKLSRVLKLTNVETNELIEYTYGNRTNSLQIYEFFTFFDRVYSMYSNKIPKWMLPSLPTNDSTETDDMTKAFYDRFAKELNQPLAKYGQATAALATVEEMAGFAQRIMGINTDEAIVHLSDLRFNKNPRIRMYHLLCVLDTYRENRLSLNYIPERHIESLGKFIPIRKSGASYLASVNYKDMGLLLGRHDFTNIFPGISAPDVEAIFSFIDSFDRGLIFSHQLAAVIDLATQSKGRVQKFPFYSNNETPREVRYVLEEHAKLLDGHRKAAYNYLVESNTNIFEQVEFQGFVRVLGHEFTNIELQMLFDCLDAPKAKYIRIYHYLACLESYCRNPLKAGAAMTIARQGGEYPVHIVLRIPTSAETPTFLSEITVNQIVNQTEFLAIMQTQLGLSIDDNFQFFHKLDKKQKGSLFGYEIFTWIDLFRACVSGGKIIRNPAELPFEWSKGTKKSIRVLLGSVAEYLDSIATATADYFSDFSPLQVVKVQDFVIASKDFNENQSAEIFRELDFENNASIRFYHFLAVVESYRRAVYQNQELKASARLRSENVISDLQNTQKPLQAALNTLGKYIAGDNPEKRALTPNEIFGLFDSNRDGQITCEEFLRCINSMRLDLDDHQKTLLLKEADMNKNGVIEYQEFLSFVNEFFRRDLNPAQGVGFVPFEKRSQDGMKGLHFNLNSFQEGSIDHAIFKLKLYVQSNHDSFSSIEYIFARLDEDLSGALNQTEFSLALERLRVNLSHGQKQGLMKLADKNRDGQIAYKEFIDFIYDYDFTKQEEELTRRVKLLKDYAIDVTYDYFRDNCTTILNSEAAALKRCIELYTKSSGRFVDPEFGNNERDLYFDGPPSSNYPDPYELVWKSPRDFQKDATFFDNDISSNDVIQGSLGDCWFIGALSVLAIRDDLIRGAFPELNNPNQIMFENCLGISQGVYPPIFHPFARKGLYVIRFFKNCSWRYVIIDERVPMIQTSRDSFEYVFGRCREKRELWVPLIEKAYAKLHKCYEALNGGNIDDALVDLTGLVAEKLKLRAPDDNLIWSQLTSFKREGTLMGCSIDAEGVESDVVVDGELTGLLSRHAYGIIDVMTIPDPQSRKLRHRLVRLRNPWGQREWCGKWSSNSAILKEKLSLVKTEIFKMPREEQFDPLDPNDGTFLMSFKDWRTLFNNLFACVDFTDNWWGVRFASEWNQNNSGGVPSGSGKQYSQEWAKNPQFVLEILKDTELFVSLSQPDARLYSLEPFPYPSEVNPICFTVTEVRKGDYKVQFFEKDKVKKLSVLKAHREVHARVSLPPGTYIIVPATQEALTIGHFWLSVYLSCEKTVARVFESSNTSNKGKEIEEENEKDYRAITIDMLDDLKNLVSYLISL